MSQRQLVQEDASEILKTLETVEGRLQELKTEREKLLESNRMLVELVEKLEEELTGFVDEEGVGDISVQGYEYSFKQGWQPKNQTHRERLELDPDVDVDEIEGQIREVRDTAERIQEYED